MNLSAVLHLRWLTRDDDASSAARRYDAPEVLDVLASHDAATVDSPRASAILRCAARPAAWIGKLDWRAARTLGQLQTSRLPTMVYWYSSGQSVDEIGQRIGYFAGGCTARRALRAAAGAIARSLNDQR